MYLDQWITQYLAFASAKGLSTTTRNKYAGHLNHFGRWWQDKFGQPPAIDAFLEANLFAYLEGEEARGQRPRSRYQKVAAFRAFGKWLFCFGHTEGNQAARVPLPKLDDPQRELMSRDEAVALLSASYRLPDEREGVLARAVLMTFLTTGVRRSELLSLAVSDLDLSARQLTVRFGKGGTTRTQPLHEATCQALAEWLEERRRRIAHGKRRSQNRSVPDSLFLSRMGMSLSHFVLRRLLLGVQAVAGFRGKTNMRPHSQRHFFTAQLVGQREDIKTIQALLGHKNVATTLLYIHTDEDRKRSAVDAIRLPEPKPKPPTPPPTPPQPDKKQTKRRRISLRKKKPDDPA